MTQVYDKKGREIMVGDLLKVDHFIGSRNKKYYIYKLVVIKNKKLFAIHLDGHTINNIRGADGYCLSQDLCIGSEIVQGYQKTGNRYYGFEDRPVDKHMIRKGFFEVT